MIILAHRGYWKNYHEQNTVHSFSNAFERGYGVELDIRDCLGNIVVSHDPAEKAELLTLNQVIGLRDSFDKQLPLAINVKSDGLTSLLQNKITLGPNDFFFDMSIPETVKYRKNALPYFSRISDIETHVFLLDNAKGLWVDGFDSDFLGYTQFTAECFKGLKFAIVSAELHGRLHADQWGILKTFLTSYPITDENFLLCTDFPDQAKEFFVANKS